MQYRLTHDLLWCGKMEGGKRKRVDEKEKLEKSTRKMGRQSGGGSGGGDWRSQVELQSCSSS